MKVTGDSWSGISRKLQSYRHEQQTSTRLFLQAGRISRHPTNRVRALWGKSITFHGPVHPKLTWSIPTLTLTADGSRLPWGRVVKPLVSRLTPAAQHVDM